MFPSPDTVRPHGAGNGQSRFSRVLILRETLALSNRKVASSNMKSCAIAGGQKDLDRHSQREGWLVERFCFLGRYFYPHRVIGHARTVISC